MKSTATTVKDYLASLPEDRRIQVEAVRKVILANLDKNYEETMLWGVAAYVVPQRVFPDGHHTDPKKPLMMCGVSSQKNDMVVYMMNVFGGGGGLGGDAALREWFEEAWVKAGKKMGMCVESGGGGGGCCIRFRKLDDIALDVIGEAIRRTPAKKFVENYVRMLGERGQGPDKKKPRAADAAKKMAGRVAKNPGKKVAKKKASR
jgi:hypothetical protein